MGRRLRATGAAVRLVAFTTCDRPEDRERSRAAGFDWHVVKPADPAVLVAVLSAVAGVE